MGYVHATMLLYHGLDATGSIEIASNPAGPWTKITLTSTQLIRDALEEWQALAEVALPSTWSFGWDDPSAQPFVWFVADVANRYVRLSPCLADLLGFSLDHPLMVSPYVLDVGFGQQASSDVVCQGMFGSDSTNRFAVGLSFPLEVEEAELTEYRAGRASTHHYGRAAEVIVDFYLAAELWALTKSSPLLSGHAAFWVQQDDYTAFGEGNVDGALTLYPIETVSIEQDSPDDHVWVRLRCTKPDDPPDVGYFYRSIGTPGDWAEVETSLAANAVFGGAGVNAIAISLWVRGDTGADATAVTVFEVSDDSSPRFRCQYAGGEIDALLAGDSGGGAQDIQFGEFDGAWQHILAIPRADAPTLIAGAELWVNGVNVGDGAPSSGSPAYATAVSKLRFFAGYDGSERLAGDIANINVFTDLTDFFDGRLAALVLAGVRHDPYDRFEGRDDLGNVVVWPGVVPAFQYRARAVEGAVRNDGNGGECRLLLNGFVRSMPL